MLWESLTSVLTKLLSFLLIFFYIKLSDQDMWFLHYLSRFYHVLFHTQIQPNKEFTKTTAGHKQTDIKTLQFFFFFSVFLPYCDSTLTEIKHGHLSGNMYWNVYKLLSLKYHSSHSDTDSVWIIHVKYVFFSWCKWRPVYIEREKTTHTNSLDKKWRVTNHCEESGNKNICLSGFTQHTHSISAVIQFVCLFYVPESLSHCVLFTILCQCARQCCGTKWCRKESNPVSSFSHISHDPGCFLSRVSCRSSVKQAAWRTTEEKNSYPDKSQAPGVLKEGHIT